MAARRGQIADEDRLSWVNALANQLAGLPSLFSGLRQRNLRVGPETNQLSPYHTGCHRTTKNPQTVTGCGLSALLWTVLDLLLVPKAGLEPARVSPHAPQACASTNSTTWALNLIPSHSRGDTYLHKINLYFSVLRELRSPLPPGSSPCLLRQPAGPPEQPAWQRQASPRSCSPGKRYRPGSLRST
jgi:hypothetical protein